MREVGRIREIVRYPVKSMAGVPLESAELGWHGLAGDRRFAFRRAGPETGMPWLTAGRFPGLLLYQPTGADESGAEPLPTHVRTPDGACLELRSAELTAEIAERSGHDVMLMRLNNGIFDDGAVSIIASSTIAGIAREAGLDLDRRRFRANILLDTDNDQPFHEEAWVGATFVFGESDAGPSVSINSPDERCAMVNMDPDTAQQDPRVMKAVVRLNKNYAGVYANVLRRGTIRVGDRVSVV